MYICFEGADGTYKTTTCAGLAKRFRENDKSVLETKEPGCHHIPLTTKLRELVLSMDYDAHMTPMARELITQAIRHIHMTVLVNPLLESGEYDYIIQDRGRLSGKFYAIGCGMAEADFDSLENFIYGEETPYYDFLIVLYRGSGADLSVAENAKQEYSNGDTMEAKGQEFQDFIHEKFMTKNFSCADNTIHVDVEKFKDSAELIDCIYNRITRK